MNSLLLVHIAKTGGTSLRRLFKSHPGISRFDCFHNGFLLRFENGCRVGRYKVNFSSLDQYDTAVVALRHPLARLRSCYNYFLSGGLNGRGIGEFPADLQNQELLKSIAPTFSACTQRLNLISAQIPHFRPVSYWINTHSKPFAKSIFCCRQESLSDDVNALFMALSMPLPSRIEHHNEAPNVSSSIPDPSLIDLQCIEKFYSSDYARFGYEMRSLRSLPLLQYWNEYQLPVVIADRMEKCRQLNPGWDYLRFNRHTASEFLAATYGPEIAAAFLDIRLPAMQADVFRVAFLLKCGGLWVDAATLLMRPVEFWIDRRHSLQLLRRSHQEHPKICSGVIYASRPGLPLLKAAWEAMVPRLLSRSGTKVYREFGPGLFRDLIVSFPNLALGLHVVPDVSLEGFLKISSSGNILPANLHWSERQKSESLYFSGK